MARRRTAVSADDAALNAGIERFNADPVASAYADLHYRPSGLLQRPLVTLHTTGDPVVPYRDELIYFTRAAFLGTEDKLTALPVARAGHCAFKPPEVAGGLAALLLKADSDLVLALLDPLRALHGIVDADIGRAGSPSWCGIGRSWIGSRANSASSRRPGMSRPMA